MAHWDGTQDQAKMVKITQNTPTCDVTPRKAQTQNENFIFRFWLQDLLNP